MNIPNVPNRTVFCDDNLDVMVGINDQCIDLIYLDPPFNKNKEFTAPIGSSAEGASFKDVFKEEDLKEEWVQTIGEDQPELHRYLTGIKGVGKSYNFAYLAYMAIRVIECHRILKETGSIYLHCDPTMSHYLKSMMDCIFGEDNFRNEIVWRIGWVSGYKTQKRGWIRNHDILLYYTKTSAAAKQFNKEYIPYPDDYVRRDGKRPTGEGMPIEDTWNCHAGDTLDSIMIKSFSTEKTGFPTQKSIALLERIIKASSNEGDFVLDPFCGCATTCVAAEKLNRKWIGIDISVKAYELVQERLAKEVDKPQRDWIKGDTAIHLKTDPPKRTDQDADHREKKFIYVISHPNFQDEYKVGIAKDWQSRLNSYQTSDPERQYKMEFRLETPWFRETEQYIHGLFPNKHEWVQGDLGKIIAAIKKYRP